MFKKIAFAVAIMMPLFAVRAYAASTSFTNASLSGTYAIGVAGFTSTDPDENLFNANGRLALTGVVSLDAAGHVTSGDFTVTYGDDSNFVLNDYDQVSCTTALDPDNDSFYFVKPDGTGQLVLVFDPGTECLEADDTIALNFALSRSLSGWNQLGLDEFGNDGSGDCVNTLDLEIDGGLPFEDVCLATLSLSGKMIHQ